MRSFDCEKTFRFSPKLIGPDTRSEKHTLACEIMSPREPRVFDCLQDFPAALGLFVDDGEKERGSCAHRPGAKLVQQRFDRCNRRRFTGGPAARDLLPRETALRERVAPKFSCRDPPCVVGKTTLGIGRERDIRVAE